MNARIMKQMLAIQDVTVLFVYIVGDHFRTLWGPYAGWAQAVCKPNISQTFKKVSCTVLKEIV